MFGIRKVVVGGRVSTLGKCHRHLYPLRHHIYKSEEKRVSSQNHSNFSATTDQEKIFMTLFQLDQCSKGLKNQNATEITKMENFMPHDNRRAAARNLNSHKVLEKLQVKNVTPHEETGSDVLDGPSLRVDLDGRLLTHYDSKDTLFSSVDWEDELLTCSDLEVNRFLPRLPNYHRDAMITHMEFTENMILLDREFIEQSSSEFIDFKSMNYRKHMLEKAKKIGIQGSASIMSEVAFSIRRKSAVVKKKCSVINASRDTTGAFPLLKTLLKAVGEFDKALTEVFERFDVKIITPKKNDLYDRHNHTALCRNPCLKPTGSESYGIIAAIRRPGVMINGQVRIRADVVVKHVGQSSQTSNEHAESAKVSGESEIPGQTTEAGPVPNDELSLADLCKLEFESEASGRLYKKVNYIRSIELQRYHAMNSTIQQEATSMECYTKQNFAVSLLDVVDNLKRAYVNVKNSFLNIDASEDTTATVSLLQTLLEDVKHANKRIVKKFKWLGVRAFYPINERFNQERHSAALQVQDTSKLPGIVAVVLEHGYTYRHYKSKDVRVIRAAKVGVTQ